MPRVIHFEIPAEDPEKIVKFYSDVFGWKIEKWGKEPYWLVDTKKGEEQGIGGAIYKKDWMTTTVNTVGVDNVEKCLEKIKKAGGKVVREPVDIPNVGRLATAADPEGTLFGVLKFSPDVKM
jgi:predicted enzyme related to lactoylglutathione lyase